MTGTTGAEVTTQLDDPFSQKAPKLATLLDRDPSCRVLLIGPDGMITAADLRSHFTTVLRATSPAELEGALSESRTYGLVIWNLVGVRWHRPGRWFAPLRRALGSSGTLLLLAENRLALRTLVRRPARMFEAGLMLGRSCRTALARAGFERIESFLPLPRWSGAEEFVNTRGGEIALPSFASRPERILARAGLYPLFHDGFACLASGRGGGTAAVLARLARTPRGEALAMEELALERFDLRDRGSLVLLLRSGASGPHVVCRIAHGAAASVVGRNAQWTEKIQQSSAVSAAVRSRVPRNRGAVRIDGAVAYLEERIPGVVAWKLAGLLHVEPALFAGMVAFASTLARDTGMEVVLGRHDLGRLLSPEVPRWVDVETASYLEALRSALAERAAGRQHLLSWSHGDYGYGNALADPASGSIRGIIDWDQARQDIAGIDLLNFLIQRSLGMRALPLPDALAAVGTRFVAGGFAHVDPRLGGADELCADPERRADLVGWTALRFAERAVRYPALFGGARAEIAAVLRWGCGLLAGRANERVPA